MRPTDACCELPAKVFYEMLAGVSEARVRRALSRDVLSQDDFLTLLGDWFKVLKIWFGKVF